MERSALRSHLSGSVPISIAVHIVAVLLILIIPLTANIELPDPAWHVPDYMPAAPVPPPPPVTRAPTAAAPTPAAPTNPDIAPTFAPEAIKPEVAAPGPPDLGLPPGAGVPEGIGIVATDKPIVITPPDPPRPAVPVRVGDLPVTPRKIVDVRPLYPEIARAARVEGTVIMEAVLDTNGRVTQLRVLKTVPMLEQAAVDAVRQWRYTPSLYGGHPVSVLMTITVRFALQ
jgi:protein TonB